MASKVGGSDPFVSWFEAAQQGYCARIIEEKKIRMKGREVFFKTPSPDPKTPYTVPVGTMPLKSLLETLPDQRENALIVLAAKLRKNAAMKKIRIYCLPELQKLAKLATDQNWKKLAENVDAYIKEVLSWKEESIHRLKPAAAIAFTRSQSDSNCSRHSPPKEKRPTSSPPGSFLLLSDAIVPDLSLAHDHSGSQPETASSQDSFTGSQP